MNRDVVQGWSARPDSTVLNRLIEQGVELVTVVGPQDKDDSCLDWVGAVLSLTGRIPGVPTLEQAMQDGLFHPGCRHTLAVFDAQRVTPSRREEAQVCTRHAMLAMEARRRSEAPPFLAIRKHLREEALRLAASKPPNESVSPQAKFERVYASARKADEAGDADTALLKCRAALDILREQDLFGESQPRLVEAIEDHIRRLTSEHAA